MINQIYYCSLTGLITVRAKRRENLERDEKNDLRFHTVLHLASQANMPLEQVRMVFQSDWTFRQRLNIVRRKSRTESEGTVNGGSFFVPASLADVEMV